MKLVYTLIALSLSINTFSQTKKIAHKSHSGSMDAFSTLSNDSFGLPPMGIDSIIWFNDTTVIQVSSIGGNWHVQKDTLVNHPLFSDSAVTVDSLKNHYYRSENTTFIGFENKCPAPSSTTRDKAMTKDNQVKMQNSSVDVYYPEMFEVESRDTSRTDTLVEPKEHIKSKEEVEKKKVIVPGENNDNGITPFQLFVLGLFLTSVFIFITLNMLNTKSSQML